MGECWKNWSVQKFILINEADTFFSQKTVSDKELIEHQFFLTVE